MVEIAMRCFVYASMHATECVDAWKQHTYIEVFRMRNITSVWVVLPHLCLDDDNDDIASGAAAAVAVAFAPRIHSLFADVFRTDKSSDKLTMHMKQHNLSKALSIQTHTHTFAQQFDGSTDSYLCCR